MDIYNAPISPLFLFEKQISPTESPGNSLLLIHFPSISFPLLAMATRTFSQIGESSETFIQQNLLKNPEKEEVAPPNAESEKRIKAVYQLPASDRSFSTHIPSSSQYSSSEMSASAKIPEVFDLDELDSYSDQVQIKKEPSPKATASSKPSSSKAIIIPKPSLATKPRSSSSRKRKEPDSPVISDIFPYENHGFIEASGFMTSFLNQGLERLVHLYQESCGLNKTLESKLKKAEVTISDQGMIAAAKSRHYEEKFKAMTQEHQATLNKAALHAQADLDVAHAQHKRDMISYRESLKGSVVTSLLQARLKMGHEAKALGFECPS
ncbi:uncharacterized protein LOC118488203 [Helianthus annuus]|uniref:uncharacterized protein LOC118488203 n=1 Tax=Helianthus annuus TaxID=4232 RepID=UPI0016530D62|nr:uncharacterized protein LOC118488203 [Helianthus annuus]